MILTLHRLMTQKEVGTIGALRLDGMPFCWTMEPYSYGNYTNNSCVPAQVYPLHPYESQRYGKTWEVGDVFGRAYILFHPGNTAKDTEGCIMPGYKLGLLGLRHAVVESRAAFTGLLKALDGPMAHQLIIREDY